MQSGLNGMTVMTPAFTRSISSGRFVPAKSARLFKDNTMMHDTRCKIQDEI